VLGQGRGHNWWCVVFPPLCTQAATAEDFEEMGLSREESRWISVDGEEYVPRFKLLEWIQGIRDVLFERDR